MNGKEKSNINETDEPMVVIAFLALDHRLEHIDRGIQLIGQSLKRSVKFFDLNGCTLQFQLQTFGSIVSPTRQKIRTDPTRAADGSRNRGCCESASKSYRLRRVHHGLVSQIDSLTPAL